MCGMCHRSVGVWDYIYLCFVLKKAACVVDVFGCIAVCMVVAMKFC
jgi:hypothetical protein